MGVINRFEGAFFRTYLLAVALLDGDVMPAQVTPDRIMRSDVQALLKKVSVRPNRVFFP
jgi:2-methylcitrate dehydratase